MAFQDRAQIIYKAPPELRDQLHDLSRREGETVAALHRAAMYDLLRARGYQVSQTATAGLVAQGRVAG
jgi:hypothetical protein